MMYTYCSICGGKLEKRDDGHLHCTNCSFVNYRNPRPTVTVLIMFENKLLMTKRKHEPFQGWWDLPGGFIDRGEHPEATALREIKEETDLTIHLDKLYGVYPGTFPSLTDPFHVLSIVYLGKCGYGALKARDDVIESRWFAKHEVPQEVAFDSNQAILKDFIQTWN